MKFLKKRDKHNLDVLNSDNPGRYSQYAEEARTQSIVSTIALLIAAPLLALFITAHVFHSYEVDGSSMETTLQNSDRLIVYKLPKTISNITNNRYIPGRGDVVVIDRPRQLAAPESVQHLIKRVIALPGERVTVKDGKVTVYNQEFPDGFNPDENPAYADAITTTSGTVDITLARNEIFVLGDNRDNSSDSRVFGPVNLDELVGKAEFRFIPINNMKRL